MNNNITITCFDNTVLDLIYSFVEQKTVKAFGLTCRKFHLIFQENEKWKMIGELVLANFELLVKNVDCRPTWLMLKNCQVFLVGEDHTKDWHRIIFAQFVHGIWP